MRLPAELESLSVQVQLSGQAATPTAIMIHITPYSVSLLQRVYVASRSLLSWHPQQRQLRLPAELGPATDQTARP